MKSSKVFALALVLTFGLLAGFGVPTLAASSLAAPGFTDTQQSPHVNEIAVLKGLGIIVGDGATNMFRPLDSITREEFAVIAVRATGNSAAAAQLDKRPTNFSDDASISPWARGAINFAVAEGWLKGYEDESFRPRQNVTFAEAVTVLMRMTGHELAVSATAVWPVGHILNAHNAGLLAGVATNPASRPLSREDMARLTYNALFIETLEPSADDEPQVSDPLASAFTVRGQVRNADVEGQTIAFSHLRTSTTAATTETYTLADQITVIGAPNVAALKGKQVRAAVNADDEITVIEVLWLGSVGSGVFKQATAGRAADTLTDIELDTGVTFTVLTSTTITINATEFGIGPGGMWHTVQAFLTDEQTGMRSGDLVTTDVDPDGVARTLDVLRLSSFDYVVESVHREARRNVLTLRRPGSTETMALSVAKTAVVDVNGHPALFTDLVVGDTVRLAISGQAHPTVGADGDRQVLWVSVTR